MIARPLIVFRTTGQMENVNHNPRLPKISPLFLIAAFVVSATLTPVLHARDKDKLSYGEGLIVNVPFTPAEVEQVVKDVAQNGIIRGTKEYNKDEYIVGAKAADSTHAFPRWTEGGKVFYKVRLQALDPRNFKDAGDLGTLAVRYVLQAQGEKNTVLRIDAVFVEDFRHTVHPSNGSVESSEYKDIKDHLDSIAVMKEQTSEAEMERQQLLLKKQSQPVNGDAGHAAPPPAPVEVATTMPANAGPAHDVQPSSRTQPEQPVTQAPTVSSPTGQTLEQHVEDLRRQVERLVKSPGAPLKSAPFHTASTLSALTTGTEVLILISTPYWYGVETRDGQHGWVLRDALEPLP